MRKRRSSKSLTLIHLWWFVAAIIVIVSGVTFLSVYNTDKILERADRNERYTTELFGKLSTESKWKLATDSTGRTYIDSVMVADAEQVKLVEDFLLYETSRQVNEYSAILTKEATAFNNSMVLWAGLLTLISVIFTFLGFMELRGRLSDIDAKSIMMDETIDNATGTIDSKVEEIHDALEAISDRREEIERIQLLLRNLSEKLDEVSQQSIQKMGDKEQALLKLYNEVKYNVDISSYNLHLQTLQNNPDIKTKISGFEKFIETVDKSETLTTGDKNRLTGEGYYLIGLSYTRNNDNNKALLYFRKCIDIDSDGTIGLKAAAQNQISVLDKNK